MQIRKKPDHLLIMIRTNKTERIHHVGQDEVWHRLDQFKIHEDGIALSFWLVLAIIS